jgi:calcineurin-like phosphoesterase family protein
MTLWVVSDLHLNHVKISEYANRPFKSIEEMNNKLVKNWNKLVKSSDTVICVGDLCLDKAKKFGLFKTNRIDYWCNKLKGTKILIKGNHDANSKKHTLYKYYILKYKNHTLLFVHDPQDIPKEWIGWVICGHSHDHKNYPFCNPIKKQFNVSVEQTKYYPISIEIIIKTIEKEESKLKIEDCCKVKYK